MNQSTNFCGYVTGPKMSQFREIFEVSRRQPKRNDEPSLAVRRGPQCEVLKSQEVHLPDSVSRIRQKILIAVRRVLDLGSRRGCARLHITI